MESPRTDADECEFISRSVQISPPSFRSTLTHAAHPRTLWSDPDGSTVVGSGAAATLVANGSDRVNTIRADAESLFSSGDVHAGTEAARPRLFGGFSFHTESATDASWEGFPSAKFVFPRVQVTWPDPAKDAAWLTVNAACSDSTADDVERLLRHKQSQIEALDTVSPLGSPPGISARQRTTEKADWRTGVTAALERIDSGELQKVVLAQALRATLDQPVQLADILKRLATRYSRCYQFMIEPQSGMNPQRAFIGATPERLISVRGRTVRTGALAGTTGRGDTPAEDEWLAKELLKDEKNAHEHELVAETICQQLQPFVSSISAEPREVQRLATVQHLRTPINATLSRDEHVLSLVESLHPTPAVGGVPPSAALETIRETEPFDRGWYAAPVGWIDAAGNGTFAVALRSALATQEQATLFAGVGIVNNSNPDREWEEMQLKFRPILDTLEAESIE